MSVRAVQKAMLTNIDVLKHFKALIIEGLQYVRVKF
jgi:hypothetical protein